MNGAAVQIMDAIRRGKGNVSKKDIQRLTGLSWGTMCKATDQLIESGYIFARREKTQGRGRPTIPLCVNSDAAYYIGIDIGAGNTRAVVCNLSFNTVYMQETETPRFEGETQFNAFLKRLIDTALRVSRIDRNRLEGIGLAVSGNVDFKNGIIVSGRNFGIPWGADLRVADFIHAEYGASAYAMTTQAAASAAEYHFGEEAGCENILTVGLGVGIGSGVVSEGQLLISRPGRPVGHIGHMLITGNKYVCTCGFRGCLEAYTGGNNLVRAARDRFPERIDFDSAHTLDRLAAAGDAQAREILDTAAVYNASGIASMIQLYIPNAIIFSGGQCREDGYLFCRTLEEIRNILPLERLENIRIRVSVLGAYQSALGAARLVYEHCFGKNESI